MVEYTCVKCEKKFHKKDNYNKHLQRKYSCIPEDRSLLKEHSLESYLELQKKKIDNLEFKQETIQLQQKTIDDLTELCKNLSLRLNDLEKCIQSAKISS